MRCTQKPGRGEFRLNRGGEFFNSLSPEAMGALEEMVVPVDCPANAVLFQEQEPATRIFILMEGCAKISVSSSAGRRMILWVAKPDQLLGLDPVLSGGRYEATAETVHRCRIASIPRQRFVDFLEQYPAVYQSVARALSVEMSRAWAQMRILGLSSLAAVRLAMLLLEWTACSPRTARGTSVRVLLTHEELGECIGAARETVTRALAELKQRELIDIHGSTFFITNRFALEAYAGTLPAVLLPAIRGRASEASRRGVAVIRAQAGLGIDPQVRQA